MLNSKTKPKKAMCCSFNDAKICIKNGMGEQLRLNLSLYRRFVAFVSFYPDNVVAVDFSYVVNALWRCRGRHSAVQGFPATLDSYFVPQLPVYEALQQRASSFDHQRCDSLLIELFADVIKGFFSVWNVDGSVCLFPGGEYYCGISVGQDLACCRYFPVPVDCHAQRVLSLPKPCRKGGIVEYYGVCPCHYRVVFRAQLVYKRSRRRCRESFRAFVRFA